MWSFEEAVEAIRGLRHRGWRFGLDRMEELCRRLGVEGGGSPRYLHVAGTNGKGSTTAFASSILGQRLRVGATYSPYVYDVRERIMGPEGMISEEDFARAAWEVCQVGDAMEATEFGGPTEFEAKTAMGFWAWNHWDLDAVVLETGLGGRLDATNIVRSEVAAIPSIGLDHTKILGDTLEAIAGEKAGIFKAGAPAVVGSVEEDLWGVFDGVASAVGAGRPLIFGRDWILEGGELVWDGGRVFLGEGRRLRGPVQRGNSGVAALACLVGGFGVSAEDVSAGVASAWLPGRFEVVSAGGRTWVFDGAHNREAAAALAAAMREDFPGRRATLIFGMLDGHEPGPLLRELAGVVERVLVVPINWSRTLAPEDLGGAARTVFGSVEEFWSVEEAVGALGGDELVLVSGSFYLLGEVRVAAGV